MHILIDILAAYGAFSFIRGCVREWRSLPGHGASYLVSGQGGVGVRVVSGRKGTRKS